MASPRRRARSAAAKAPQKRVYKSGAQKAREKKAREAKARLEAHQRERAEAPPLVEVGQPPNDAVARIAWANRAAGIVLAEVMSDPMLDRERRWKIALEAVRSLGMTSSKAVNEERLERLEEKIYGKGPDAKDGLEDLDSSS